MRIVHARHLVIGGGLLGLATADHLLRRGAEGVVIVEAGRALGNLRPERPGVVLSTGRSQDADLEARNRVLLEEWPSYLEVDPTYRRSGSFQLPRVTSPPPGWEELDGRELAQRLGRGDAAPVESAGAAFERGAHFVPGDGVVDVEVIVSALHDQIRRRGGRVVSESFVTRVRRDDGIHFEAGQRGGRAEKVYLAAGAGNLLLAHQLELPLAARGVVRHQFDLVGAPVDFRIVRSLGAGRSPASEATTDAVGLELEFEGVEERSSSEPRESESPTEVLVELRDGRRSLACYRPGLPGGAEPEVEFPEWPSFAEELGSILPELRDCSVRTASAHATLALSPSLEPETNGKDVWAAGGFGAHGLAVVFAVAERLAEAGLDS